MTVEDFEARGDYENEGCPETIWEDEEEGRLLDPGDLAERDCPACKYWYDLWADLLEDTGTSEYGHMVFYIMGLEADGNVDPTLLHGLHAWEHEMIKIYRSELRKFEEMRMQESTRQTTTQSVQQDYDD